MNQAETTVPAYAHEHAHAHAHAQTHTLTDIQSDTCADTHTDARTVHLSVRSIPPVIMRDWGPLPLEWTSR